MAQALVDSHCHLDPEYFPGGPDEVMTTTDMSIRFLAPCLTDLRVEANVLKLGRTLAPVQVDLFDAKDKRVAVAQVTYMRLPEIPRR